MYAKTVHGEEVVALVRKGRYAVFEGGKRRGSGHGMYACNKSRLEWVWRPAVAGAGGWSLEREIKKTIRCGGEDRMHMGWVGHNLGYSR